MMIDCSTEDTAIGRMACEVLLMSSLKDTLRASQPKNTKFWQAKSNGPESSQDSSGAQGMVRSVPLATACKHLGAPVQEHVQCWDDKDEHTISTREGEAIRPVGVYTPFHKMGCNLSRDLMGSADNLTNVEAFSFDRYRHTLQSKKYIKELAESVTLLYHMGDYNDKDEHGKVHILSGACDPKSAFDNILFLDKSMPEGVKPRVLVILRHFADTLVRS